MKEPAAAEGGLAPEGLSDRLRLWRTVESLSQAEAAERIGTVQQTVGRWENGQTPQARFHPRLAELLGVAREDLVDLIVVDEQRTSAAVSSSAPLTAHQQQAFEVLGDLVERRVVGADGPISAEDVEIVMAYLKIAGFDDL